MRTTTDRQRSALPTTGQHLVELVYMRNGVSADDTLGGLYFTGVVGATVDMRNWADTKHKALSGFWCADDGGTKVSGDGISKLPIIMPSPTATAFGC